MIKVMLKSTYEDMQRQINVAEQLAHDIDSKLRHKSAKIKVLKKTILKYERNFFGDSFDFAEASINTELTTLFERILTNLKEKESVIKDYSEGLTHKDVLIQQRNELLDDLGTKYSEILKENKQLKVDATYTESQLQHKTASNGGLKKANNKYRQRIAELEQQVERLQKQLKSDHVIKSVSEYDYRIKTVDDVKKEVK